MITIEELLQYVQTLVNDGLLILKNGAYQAVTLLHEHQLIQCIGEDDALTLRSISFIYTVCSHDVPLGAEHLLSTLECFGLLEEGYALTDENLHMISQVVYPEEVASILDRIYSSGLRREKVQDYFEQLQRLSAVNSVVNETSIVLLQVRIQERMGTPTWSLHEFEDELRIAVSAHGATRENLAALAHDRESAIQPLMPQEERRFKKVIAYYAPMIEARGGVDACYASLLHELKMRYDREPLFIKLFSLKPGAPSSSSFFSKYKGSELFLRLPLEWDDFQKLPLTKANKDRALSFYYQNFIHSAYRFFKDIESPGPWLADQKYWESFVDYKHILVVLWLAVTDTNIPLIDDFTIEGRIEYFIRSFAEFRREKNFEGRREIATSPGKYEYYDDNEPDKPGCRLGFRDRAYDAVRGHPLFGLTNQAMLHEVQHYMLEHFKTKLERIQEADLSKLSYYWNKVIHAELEGELEHRESEKRLAMLNVPKRKQEQWLHSLQEKYVDLAEDASFVTTYWNLMSFTLFPTHAHRFGGTFLGPFLERQLEQRKRELSHGERSILGCSV